jgi:hypothetical protein
MDQSVNIPWAPGMNYGMGVNLLTGDIAGKAIKPIEDKKEISEPTNAGGQTVSYDLVQINSMEELYSSIGMSVEASGRYGLFNASAKAKYANESKFNSQSTFLMARCVVMNAFTQIEDPQIKDEAISLFQNEEKFRDRYGDGYVRGMQTGGEFFVLISITSSAKEEQQSIAADIKATYGTKFSKVEGEASLKAETESKISKSEIRVSTYQRGGRGEGQALVETVKAAIERLKAFPAQVEANPVPYEVQVANYYTLPFSEEAQNPVDLENQKFALEEYARNQLKYISLRNDVEFMQLHPEYYKSLIEIETLNQWNNFFTERITEVRKKASKCASGTEVCDSIEFNLPEDFDKFYEAQKQREGRNLEEQDLEEQDLKSVRKYYKEVIKNLILSSDPQFARMFYDGLNFLTADLNDYQLQDYLPFMIFLKPDLLKKSDVFESFKAFTEYTLSESGMAEFESYRDELRSSVNKHIQTYGSVT